MTRQISDIDEGTIRRVDWQELAPPTIFFRAFPATFKISFLILGALALALFASALGWRGEGTLRLNLCDGGARVSLNADGSLDRNGDNKENARFLSSRFLSSYATWGDAVWEDGDRPWFPLVLVLGAVFAVLFALAISRTTLARLTTASRSSTLSSLRFALRKAPSLIVPVAILFAFFCAVYFLGICVLWSGGVGRLAAPIVVFCYFALFVLIFVASCSLPLAISAIAADRSDGFDATSRSISYLTQRFAFWLLYYCFAAILILVGYAIVEAFSNVVLRFFNEIYLERSFDQWTSFWRLFVIAVPIAYLGVAFVVYSNAIYLALRRSVDGTPYDEFALDSNGEKPRKLRRILQDAKGAPILDDAKKNGVATPASGKDETN